MTYDKLMVDIGERLRDWHFAHPHAPTALYMGQAQKAVVCDMMARRVVRNIDDEMRGEIQKRFKGYALHFTEDADYVALG